MKYERLPFDAYRKLAGTNWTRLKSLRTSALQYLHDEANPAEETAILRVGIGTHARVLEPAELARRCVVFEGKVRRGKVWDAFQIEHAGKIIYSQSEWDRALGAGDAVLANPWAQNYLHHGLHELAVTWKDEETGLDLKCRADHAGPWLVELKSTGQIEPRLFAGVAARLGYHCQLAYQDDGLRANGIETFAEKIMVVVQSEAPFDVIVYRVPPHVVEIGRAEVRKLLRRLAECRATKKWPGLAPEGTREFSLPAWALMGEGEPLNLTSGGSPMEW